MKEIRNVPVLSIYQGDALSVLKTLPSESVDMCMTSPPYWALRDYGVVGQLGLEPTFQEYINKLVIIFDQVKRVLKKEGSAWVVIGDTYSGNKQGNTNGLGQGTVKQKDGINDFRFIKERQQSIPDKSLCMIPERFAISMIDHSWILRNKIIWHKRNCMPSSAKDRFTVDYEYVYFFTKSQKYYFETQYQPMSESSSDRYNYKFGGNNKARGTKESSVHKGDFADRCYFPDARTIKPNESGRIKRAVWTINTSPFPEAHFAVYPEKLCETPIKAGCPVGGIVLDCFTGAGTTGLVALKLARNFIGVELNPEYIKIAQKRLEPYLQQTKLVTSFH